MFIIQSTHTILEYRVIQLCTYIISNGKKVLQSRQHGIARKRYKRHFVLFMVRIKKK